MSSLRTPEWSQSVAPQMVRSIRPSLREVCLVGSAQPDDSPGVVRPSGEEMVPHLGRVYRVAEAQDARPRDIRQYLHLVPLVPAPLRT